jgi:hypothetical protein
MFNASKIQGEGSIAFCIQKKLEPLLLAHIGALKIIKNEIKLRKLWPPKVEGVKNSKKQTTKCYKGWFLNTQKLLLCCSIIIKIQRSVVKL